MEIVNVDIKKRKIYEQLSLKGKYNYSWIRREKWTIIVLFD